MYQKPTISAPWLGWKDDLPGIMNPPNSFKQITGWILQKGRICSMLKTTSFPNPPNGEVILGARTFFDILGNLHTVILTQDNAYYLTNNNVFTPIGAAFNAPVSANPFAVEVTLNRVFFSNGAQGQKLSYVDGSADLQTPATVQGSCYFLGKLAAHLIMAYTIEGGVLNPCRVRWSKSGDPTNWTDFSAGVDDLSDVEDQITGYTTIGTSGFVFRNNGITAMDPTGLKLLHRAGWNWVLIPIHTGYVWELLRVRGA
jgi:hypothetical protein